MAAQLRSGGYFAVEAFVPAEDAPPSGVEPARIGVDEVVLSAYRHDAGDQRVEGSLVSVTEGGIRLCPWQIRYAAPAELDAMAADAGLELAWRRSGWRDEPFSEESSMHVSAYRRPDLGRGPRRAGIDAT
ncbi:MAG: hypothetical protein ACRDZ9_00795 [Acidimicrobiales bacterium]